MRKSVIRLVTYEPTILTTDEFERLMSEVAATAMADPGTVGNRILQRLVKEHHSRYVVAKERNAYLDSLEKRDNYLTSLENEV